MRPILWAALAAGLLGGGLGLLQVRAQDRKTGAGPAPETARLRSSIDGYKTRLAGEGKYACCVRPACDMCATRMGMCPCGANAAAGKPVCRECKGGWAAGEGAVSGKRPGDIPVMPVRMKQKK